ncbi:MAG: MFS transporter [Pseudomonadota bacterium]|nr:MFS transporter [Pseudomonadota bacterium]
MSKSNFYIENARWLSAGALMTFSTAFGQTFFISIFAGEIRTYFDISHSIWGMIYAIGTLASAFTMIVFGGLADKYEPRKITMAIMLLFIFFALLMSTVNFIWVLPFIIFGLRFCGQGMLFHLSMVFAGRWFSKNRGRTIGIASLGLSLSEATLPYLFVISIGLYGWRASWGLAALSIGFLMVPLFFLLSKERNPKFLDHDSGQRQSGMFARHWTRSDVLRHWVFWAVLPAFLFQSIFGTTFFFQQVYLVEIKGWQLSQYVALIPVYTATSLVGLFFGSVFIDRYGTSILLPIYMLPMTVGLIIVVFAKTLLGAAMCFAFMGLMQGLGNTVSGAFWPEYFGTKFLGSVRSVATSLMVFASALGPLFSGYLLDIGFDLPDQYLGMAFLTILSSVGLLVVSLGARRAFR